MYSYGEVAQRCVSASLQGNLKLGVYSVSPVTETDSKELVPVTNNDQIRRLLKTVEPEATIRTARTVAVHKEHEIALLRDAAKYMPCVNAVDRRGTPFWGESEKGRLASLSRRWKNRRGKDLRKFDVRRSLSWEAP